MRHITQNGLDLIKYFEGFSSCVYVCPGGFKTIGYGHVIKSEEDYSEGVTVDLAEGLLRLDITLAEKAVEKLINVPLTDGQFDALVSFTYNLGEGSLQRSTLRKRVNREEHDKVPYEFSRWVFAGGHKLTGLIRRREAELTLYKI